MRNKYLQTAKENRFGGQENIVKKCKKTKNNLKKSRLDTDAIAVIESEPAFLVCEGSQVNLGYFLLDTLVKVSLIQKEFEYVRRK